MAQHQHQSQQSVSRRTFLTGTAAVLGAGLSTSKAMGARAWLNVPSSAARPAMKLGVQCGDVSSDRAVIWSATDRPARMIVEWSTRPDLREATVIRGPEALPELGGMAKVRVDDLPPGSEVHYRVRFEDLDRIGDVSEGLTGSFRTADAEPRDLRDVTFCWSGDTAGQGWGINPSWGGMKIYDRMRELRPDFFIHCGDMIYADGPMPREVALPDGSTWTNLVTPAKSKVAETVEEFRGNYEYNLSDACVQRFNAEVPQYVLWDDHEVTNNWYPGRMLEDDRYSVRSASLLAARARRAMMDCTPIRADATGHDRVYRHFSRGPLLDVFCLDMRSYRGTNTANMQSEPGEESRILGAEQLRWLKRALNRSKAVWKVIASDMPIGLLVPHDATRQAWEAVAQGDPGGVTGARGRELEIADLLAFIKREEVANVVWVTADVHYCATHHYHPDRAGFQDFTPFYEFVSGPLHAGGFGPNDLDGTFGPRVLFSKHPGKGRSNTNPTEGLLFFGHVTIRGATREMVVAHRDVNGATLNEITLAPA